MRVLLPLTVLALFVAGCASVSTDSTTYKSQAGKGQEFWKVAVWAKAGLAARKQTEVAAVRALRERGIDAYSSLTVWDIDAPEEEMQQRLSAAGIGAVLVLSVDSASTSVSSVGTISSTRLWGNTSVTNSATVAQVKDSAVYSATLFSAANGRVVWQSQASANGNEYADWNDIRKAFIDRTANDFVQARIVYVCVLPPTPTERSSQHYKDVYAEKVAAQGPEGCPAQPLASK